MSENTTDQSQQEDKFLDAVNRAAQEVRAVQGSPIHLLTGKPSENIGNRCAIVGGALGFAIIHEGAGDDDDPNRIIEISGSTVVDCSKTITEDGESVVSAEDGNIVDRYDVNVTFFSARMIPKVQAALQAASSMFFQTGVNTVFTQLKAAGADGGALKDVPEEAPQGEDKQPDNISKFPGAE